MEPGVAKKLLRKAVIAEQPAACSCMFESLCALDERDVPTDLPPMLENVDWFEYADETPDECQELSCPQQDEPIVKPTLVHKLRRRLPFKKKKVRPRPPPIAEPPPPPPPPPPVVKAIDFSTLHDPPSPMSLAPPSTQSEPSDTCTTYSDMVDRQHSPMTPLSFWLAERKLEKYEPALSRMGVRRLSDLAYITDDDLANLNVDVASRSYFQVHVVA